MPLFYVYVFNHLGEEFNIYAESRTDATKEFEEYVAKKKASGELGPEVEVGPFIRREPW